MRTRFYVLLAIIAVLLSIGLGLIVKRSSTYSVEKHRDEWTRLSEIPVPSESTLVRTGSDNRPDHGSFANYFASNLEYEEIRRYYDEQLRKRGWQFKRETHDLNWGADFDQKTFVYCKEHSVVALSFTGRLQYTAGYKYGLTLVWENSDCG